MDLYCVSYSLNSLNGVKKGLYRGAIFWLIQGDIKGLDYSSRWGDCHPETGSMARGNVACKMPTRTVKTRGFKG